MKYGRTESDVPEINVDDVALIFEGGGMRASQTSGVVAALIENDINFGKVYGISAGSSHTMNYVSRDVPRALHSFTEFLGYDKAMNKHGLLSGRGLFNSPYLYEGIAGELDGTDAPMAFDWEMFCANPADVHIEAYDAEADETVAFEKADMTDMRTALTQVRASSTMPIFMEPTLLGGRVYVDGGLGTSWGIALDAAKRDGFDRFFVVRTQPKGFRKKTLPGYQKAFLRATSKDVPNIAEKTIERPERYNEICDELEALEKSGAAYVYYPERMGVTNRTTDVEKLKASMHEGVAQSELEMAAWKDWLDL